MNKIVNLFLLILIIFFFFNIFNYYSSNINIKNINSNRSNINEILQKKIVNIPILNNDTNDVIEFNSAFSNQIKDSETRSFWNLLKLK